MALTGANNEERIWNYLKAKGLNDYGVAGCMGNLFAESALKSNNLQNTYEKKLGYTDDEYVAAVDSGKYTNFVRDSAGFGLAQWTYWSRKQNLLNFAKSKNKSIGDLEMQLDFLWKELSESYKSVLNTLKTATSVLAASNDMLLKFERPANQGESVQKKRAEYGQKYYDKYASQTAQKPSGATGTAQAGNSSTTTQSGSTGKSEPSVGDIVKFKGTTHFSSSNSTKAVACKPGEAKVTAISKNAKHPYHLQRTQGSSSTVYGWVDAADIEGVPTSIPQTTTQSSSNFKKRTTAPSSTDKYWIHTSNGGLNECIEINNSGSCLPNCVGYAWGRFYEITGKRPALSRANAENWYGYTSDGYKRSQTPVEGAVICWRKGQAGVSSDGAGHVAIVEEVKSNGDVVTSNSAYGGTRFYMQTVTKASGYSIGSAYTFQGFILPPAATSAGTTTTTKPTTTTNTSTGGTGMKYNSSNKPLVCMMTQSTCYKGTSKMKPVGVLWHSTGANNPWLKRYVQPDDNASNRAELINLIGKNSYNNDWNHITRQAGLNCWIGKLADGTVTTIQTMPWDYKPWGCGSGSKGSCNNGWIQFEICEDGLTDSTYFNKVYKEACEITAYLCDLYDIDPNGYTMLNGVKVPNILCHADSCKLGLGSNHGDVNHWFPKHGKSMATARADVAKLMGSTTSNSTVKPETSTTTKPQTTSGVKEGDVVKIASDATYYNGKVVPSWVKNKNWVVSEVSGDRAIIDKSEDGKNAICSPINTKYLTVAKAVSVETEFEPYRVKVNADALNIRKGAGTNYAIAGTIKNKGVYTIVAESDGKGASKWGKLKSGAGWISLDYADKV